MANGPSYARWSLEPYSIGMKLRTLRTQKHLTLSRLAAETGLSTALLSKLETDRMIPTLPTLANICRVYGVGLSYFFSDATKHTLAITRKAHLVGNGRGQEAVEADCSSCAECEAQLVARMMEYPPGAAGMMSEVGRSGAAWSMCSRGSCNWMPGGMHEVLETGDCAYVDSDMAMAWSAGGTERCRALVVTPEVAPRKLMSADATCSEPGSGRNSRSLPLWVRVCRMFWSFKDNARTARTCDPT